MGPNGDASFDAFDPAVSYNPTDNEYLVVWRGDDNTAPLVDQEFEIFGRRLNAGTGSTLQNDFRLSDMGPNGGASFAAARPAVAHNATNNEHLVVWDGDDDTPPLADNEFEIFGQRFGPLQGDVGTFTLAPAEVTVAGRQPVTFELVWTHPGVWRDLATIDVRVVGSGGDPLIWLRWEEAPNTFSLFRAGQFRHPLTPGGNGGHETPWASLPLADTAVIGSGPTGQSVTLRLPLSFKPKATGGTYQIEVAATDDLGNTQDFERAGTVRVVR